MSQHGRNPTTVQENSETSAGSTQGCYPGRSGCRLGIQYLPLIKEGNHDGSTERGYSGTGDRGA